MKNLNYVVTILMGFGALFAMQSPGENAKPETKPAAQVEPQGTAAAAVEAAWQGKKLVYIGARDCPACPAAHKLAEQLKENGQAVYFYDRDLGNGPAVCQRFKTGDAVPQLLEVRDGNLAEQAVGSDEIKAYAGRWGVFPWNETNTEIPAPIPAILPMQTSGSCSGGACRTMTATPSTRFFARPMTRSRVGLFRRSSCGPGGCQ